MSNNDPMRGLLIVVSAPSGTGKTTAVDRLVEMVPSLEKSRSFTSRAVRPGERDGVDYNYISRDAFQEMVRRDEFLEWADVFGNLYGTGRRETESRLAAGSDLVLVIDVQGARQVRQRVADTIGIFVLPPSLSVLERRLRSRSRDGEAEIARRLNTAKHEIAAVDEYDFVVVNDDDDLERCVQEMAAIVTAERSRLARRRGAIAPIVRSFAGSNEK